MAKAKPRGKPFQKGKSGNPSGRPKVKEEFTAKARRAVDEHVIAAWILEVETQGQHWVKCSELLAGYGYGKPSQSTESTVTVNKPIDLRDWSTEELILELKS